MTHDARKVETPTLRGLIHDCGGPTAVARELGCSPQWVHSMIQRGHLPYSELKEKKRAEVLAGMQKTGNLTANQIRRIGFGI